MKKKAAEKSKGQILTDGDKKLTMKFLDMARHPERYPQAKAIFSLIRSEAELSKNDSLRTEFPSVDILVRALGEGCHLTAMGAIRDLQKEIFEKSPAAKKEAEEEAQKEENARISNILFHLKDVKEPLTFIVETFEGGGAVKASYMAAEAFSYMAKRALGDLKDAMKEAERAEGDRNGSREGGVP